MVEVLPVAQLMMMMMMIIMMMMMMIMMMMMMMMMMPFESLCGWPFQDRNRFWCFRSWSSFCSRPFQDMNLLFWWRCLDFANSCPLQHRGTDLKIPLLCVFKSVPSYKWIIPLVIPLSDPLFDVSNLCCKTSSPTPGRPDWSPQDVRDLRLAIRL